jgi:hypothetical protein
MRKEDKYISSGYNKINNNLIQFFIIYVPSQQPRSTL